MVRKGVRMNPSEQQELPLTADSIVWLQVWFPRPYTEAAAFGVVRHWASQAHAPQIILEARSSVGRDGVTVDYLIGCRLRFMERVRATVETLVPGSMVSHFLDRRAPVTTARRVEASSAARLLEPADPVASARSVLEALTSVGANEQLVLQLSLGPRQRPQLPPPQPHHPEQSVVSKVLDGIKPAPAADATQALGKKRGQHGFAATLRIGVSAFGDQRRKSLLLGLASALGTLNAPGVHLVLRPDNSKRLNVPGASWVFWPVIGQACHLGVSEVVRLTGWPVSDKEDRFPGQTPLHPKRIRPTPPLLTGDMVLAKANAPGVTGSIGYTITDAMRHTWLLGPNGTGKSTLILNLVVQAMLQNRPVVVIEPKDLVADILSRIPDHRKHDVVLLDPLDDCPVGINVFDRLRSGGTGSSPEVVADNIFGMFHSLYGDNLGARSSDILRNCLDVIACRDDASLIMLPLILTNPAFRQRLTRQAMQRDPFASGSFWAWFDGLTPEAAANIVAPLSNKVRPLIDLHLRGVLAQPSPRFNVRQALQQKKALLVPLQSGVVGPEGAALTSAVVLGELWQAIKERAGTPESSREPVLIVIDEVQDFLRVPANLGDALATARSLRAGFVLAHQFERQLPASMLDAFRNNARNRVCFQLGDDAKDMAAGQSVLAPEDFTSLPAHHVYTRLVRDNTIQPWASGVTLPPPPKTSDPAEIRRLSREQYGRPRAEIEDEFRQLLDEPATSHDRPARPDGQSRGRRRRQP